MSSQALWSQLTHGNAAKPFWAIRTQRLVTTTARFLPTAIAWGGTAALAGYFAFRPHIPTLIHTLLVDVGLKKD